MARMLEGAGVETRPCALTTEEDTTPAEPDGVASSSSSSVSISSLSTSLSSSPSVKRRRGPTRGTHTNVRIVAVAGVLPFLRQVLAKPGALLKADRFNVREALKLAKDAGECTWEPGPNQVYKSIRTIEHAIINLYYSGITAEFADH